MHQIIYPHGYVFGSVVVSYLGVFFVCVYSSLDSLGALSAFFPFIIGVFTVDPNHTQIVTQIV
jgi:hypothetical protein